MTNCADGHALDRTVDSVSGFRAPGRGGRRGDRPPAPTCAFRRDGQSLRAEPDDRAAGVRGAAPARHPGADRRAPDGASRSIASCRISRAAGATYISFHPEASEHVDRTIAADPRAWLQARAGVQSGHAARLARLHARQARPGAADVGQPGLRRPAVHSRACCRRSPRCAGACAPAGATCASKWTAASRSTTSPRRRAPAPIPSSPARRSSAARTTPRRSRHCARRIARRRCRLTRSPSGYSSSSSSSSSSSTSGAGGHRPWRGGHRRRAGRHDRPGASSSSGAH